jgi:Xaa-Pro dipeptidase
MRVTGCTMLNRYDVMTAGLAGGDARRDPGIYASGKFSVRVEDCFHMTNTGPNWFSEPRRSIEWGN